MKFFRVKDEDVFPKDESVFLSSPCFGSACSQIEEEHTDKDQQKVDYLASEVLFMEYHGSEQERYHYTASAYHGYDGNHGIVHA